MQLYCKLKWMTALASIHTILYCGQQIELHLFLKMPLWYSRDCFLPSCFSLSTPKWDDQQEDVKAKAFLAQICTDCVIIHYNSCGYMEMRYKCMSIWKCTVGGHNLNASFKYWWPDWLSGPQVERRKYRNKHVTYLNKWGHCELLVSKTLKLKIMGNWNEAVLEGTDPMKRKVCAGIFW